MKQATQQAITSRPWFEAWFDSGYYHQLYGYRNEQEAFGFMENLLSFLNPQPGSTMVDIGCGKGRHARMLAARGFDVTGFDLSPASIREAKQYASSLLRFYQHDMRRPLQVSYFNYAFNLFTSFGYFNSKEGNREAALAFSQMLRPGGTLVIDYLNEALVARQLVPFEEKLIGFNRYFITRSMDTRHFYKMIRIKRPGGHDLGFEECVARLSLKDFDHLFIPNGMKRVAVFGSYQLDRFDPETSSRMIMLYKKEEGTS